MPNATTDELKYSGKFLSFYQRGKWEFVRRANAHAVVAIAALTNEGEMVLIEQCRPVIGAAGASIIEVPAGLVGDDGAEDDILDAARRELLEECGYSAEGVQFFSSGPSSAGLCDEIISLVVCSGLRKVAAGGGVGDEQITTQLIPLAELDQYLAGRVASGALVDPKVYAAAYALNTLRKHL